MGKDVNELKKIWVLTVYNLYTSERHPHDEQRQKMEEK